MGVEYFVVEGTSVRDTALTDQLDRLAKEYWRLVNVVSVTTDEPPDTILMFLERETGEPGLE